MRRLLGVLLVVLGLPVALAAGAGAAYVGPDDTVELVDQRLRSDTPVVASPTIAPRLTGPTVRVTVDAGDDETFVGIANPVHVDSYLTGVSHERLSDLRFRGDLTTTAVAGELSSPPAPPDGLDWWERTSSGPQARSVSFELTGEPLRVVLATADLATPLSARVGVTAELQGVFGAALLVAGAGLLVAVIGWLLVRSAARRRRAHGRRRRSSSGAPVDSPDRLGAASVAVPVVIPVVMVALVLAGCAPMPGLAGEAPPTPSVPAVTHADARDFFARYSDAATTAAAGHDGELIASVEGGSLLAASKVRFATEAAGGGAPGTAVVVAPTTVAAPRLTSYPLWFVAEADAPGGDGATDHYLVVRESATAPWLATLRVRVAAGVAAGQVAGDRETADLGDRSLGTHGQDVLDALLAYAETGTAPADVDLSNAGGLTALPGQGFAIAATTAAYGTEDRSCRLAEPTQPRWLADESGAFTLAAIECTQAITLSRGYWMTTPAEGYWTIPGGVDIVASTITQAVSFVVTVHGDGSATVVGDQLTPTALAFTPR